MDCPTVCLERYQKIYHYIAFVVCFFTLSKGLSAQGLNFVRFQESNDIFSGENKDRYFTQGLKCEVMSTGIGKLYQKIGLNTFFVKIKEDTSHKDHYSIVFTQDFYTPSNKNADTIVLGDRPFAGTMFLTFRNTSVSLSKRQRIISEIALGVLGSAALGKEMQNGVHTLLSKYNSNNNVNGWDYQLNNDFYFNYLLHLENAVFSSKFLEANSIYEFNLGTIYDDFGIGGRMRMGLFKNFFNENLGYATRQDKFKTIGKMLRGTSQCYVFFNPVAKMVLYNALLQGGIYNNVMSREQYRLSEDDISRFVVDGNYGLGMLVGRFKLEFIEYFRSKEFEQGSNHGWGNVVVTYSW